MAKPRIKFYKYNSYADIPTTVEAGGIYWVENTGFTYIAKNTAKNDLVKFGGGIDSSLYSESKLTLYADNGTKSYLDISDMASKAAFTEHVTAAEARMTALDSAGDDSGNNKGRVTILEEQVAALSSATHFAGKVEVENDLAQDAPVDDYDNGDIIIYGNSEYILYEDSSNTKSWILLGDTTDEQARLLVLEDWKSEVDSLHNWAEW